MRAFRVTVPEADEDLATALLWEAGTAGIEVAPSRDGRAVLLAYFADEASLEPLAAGIPAATVESVPVPDVDWVARFRESFRAFRAGQFLIAPPWDEWDGTSDGGERLVIDPGRAFGTGTHESTRLCLRALEVLARQRSLGRVIDVGTGTGILAIAALRLGADAAVATDTDPDALSAARAHAELNRVSLSLVRADGPRPLRPRSADLVLANLTAPLLVTHAAGLSALRAPGAALILSGLLEDDMDTVTAAYEACGRPEVLRDGEWAALVYGAGS
jgi:ribosomal protein L11 methyltransferase